MSNRIYLALMLLLSGISAWYPLAWFADFWAHAAVGRWIWEQGRVPHEAIFLWSSNAPWVAHSWLSQLLFYLTMRLGGDSTGPLLVLIMTMLLVMATFGLLWRLWSQSARITLLTPFLFALAINGSRERFGTRPELFTALFMVCLLCFLVNWPELSRQPAESRKISGKLAVPLTVAMFTLWANLHGAVVMGLIILAVTLVGDALQDRLSAATRRLALIALACCAAACINPFGLKYWTALGAVKSHTFSLLDEWKPPFAERMLPSDMIATSAILLVVALAAWGMNPQRRWSQLGWLLVMGAFFLQARRNMWLLNLTSLAVIAANAQLLDTRRLWHEWMTRRGPETETPPPQRTGKKRGLEPARATEEVFHEVPPRLRRIGQVAVVACFLLWIGLKVSEVWPVSTLSRSMPDSKIAFIRDRKLTGNVFNSIEDSPYLEWRLEGKVPLFIDILNAYPDQVTRDYSDLISDTPRGRELLKSHNIKYVILANTGSNTRGGIAEYLATQEPQWKVIYTDRDGMVWERQQ